MQVSETFQACVRAALYASYRVPLPPLLPRFCLLQLGFECLRVSVLAVLVQDVHQVGDVAGGQPKRLDLGQLGVGGDIGDTLPQFREGRVNTLGPPPLFPVCSRSPFHCPRMCVVMMMMMHTHLGSVHSDGASTGDQRAVSVVVMVVVRIQATDGPRATVAVVIWTVARSEAVLGGRHVRVTNKPAREIRRRSGVLVTPTRRGRVQGVVVAVVVVHDRMVREA